jgi:Tol biopolymer transport system component
VRVSSAGGEPKPVLELDSARQERLQFWPQFLPDSRHFIYLSSSSDSGKNAICLGALDSKQTHPLVYTTGRAGFMEPGYLLFERQGTLLAQPFDTGKLQLAGEATPLASLGGNSGFYLTSRFSVSTNGILVYRSSGAGEAGPTWYNRDGRRLGTVGDRGAFRNMTLSPDEKRLALERTDPGLGTTDIWVVELSSGIPSRVTFDPGSEGNPVWSPDSRQIVYDFRAPGKMGIARKTVGGGPEEVLFESKNALYPQDWLKDGASVLCLNSTGKAFYRLPLSGERKLETLLETRFDKDEPHVSPDGRWIAYNSTESGRWEVYVAGFPSFTEKRQVSGGGGGQPLWRKDGKELYYMTLDGALTAVDVKTGATVGIGPPRTLFQTRLSINPILDQYRVTGDGQKFIIADPVEEGPQPFTVVLNAAAVLRP